MTFDQAGLNISGRLHPCPKAPESVAVQFPGELKSFMYQDEVVELCARATRLVCQNRFPPRRQLILGFRTPGRSAVRGFPLCLSSPRLLFPLFSAQNKSNGDEDKVKDE